MKPSRRFAALRAKSRVACILAATASVAGCAGGLANPLATAPIDPASPIAAEVADVAASQRTYPAWTDIPQKPTDQRRLKAWGQAAAEVEAARDKLVNETTGPGAWSLGGTDAFANSAAADSGPEGALGNSAATEAFARAARARATPPPSPN